MSCWVNRQAVQLADCQTSEADATTRVVLRIDGTEHESNHHGVGPVEAVTTALRCHGIEITVLSLHQTSVRSGANAEALTLLEYRSLDGTQWAAGRDRSVLTASLKAVIQAAGRRHTLVPA